MDYIRLKGMIFFAFHGLNPDEAERGQRFELDVELGGDFSKAAHADSIDHGVDYADIYRVVEEIVAGRRFQLLESLAEVIANTLLDKFPHTQVKVTVRKPHVPLPGLLECAEVELTRCRKR